MIQMVDLLGQHQKIQNEIDLALKETIQKSAFIKGPSVIEFCNKLAMYLGCKHVVACGNGTDALQIALMALDLKAGDEVLVPDFTFVAPAETAALLGLKPVFVEVDKDDFTMDIEDLKTKISPKSKAIIPVHLYGQCANMEEIMDIAEKKGLTVIEDNAQALGSDVKFRGKWKKAGTVAHIGCTSFFPSKNLGCMGDGGAIFTDDDALANKLASIASHGFEQKYSSARIGLNSRLDSIQAAILLVKLNYLDSYNKSRKEAADRYDNLLKDMEELSIPMRVERSNHVFHQYTIKAKDRDGLKEFLKTQGIPTMVYYPIPIHLQGPYRQDGDFPVSEKLCGHVLSLPMHTELKAKDQAYIANAIKNYYQKK